MAAKVPPLDILKDSRVNCYSVMTREPIVDYLSMVDSAYKNRGGLEGQREKLRTTSAIRIRKRMVEDIAAGAVLPPIVIGVVLPKAKFKKVSLLTSSGLRGLLAGLEPDRLSIIDGMQRTTALYEASQPQSRLSTLPSGDIRIEYWISESTNSLIYRMLVLNTGQVPWNLRRQVEVVFRSLIVEIKHLVPSISVLNQTGEAGRRTRGGQFQADELVELFLVFGARKEKVDIRERLADEFTRLDFVEAAADDSFTEHFCSTLAALAMLDLAFDKFKPAKNSAVRFSTGKDIFSSQPACVGFTTAIATAVFGRPGISRPKAEQEKKLSSLTRGVSKLTKQLANLDNVALGEFLALQTLNEAISRGRPGLSVGDAEREFFLKAFQVLIEEDFKLDSLAPCWRAY